VITVGEHIGNFFSWARDHVARGLLALGVTPNILTIVGMLITLTASVCLGLGFWLWAAIALVAAGACDMLDGAVARVGNKGSAFGGILDSTCDRVGDIALLAGLGFYYLVTWTQSDGLIARPANLTYGLLAVMGIIHITLISYIRARTENEIGFCDIGFWRRGERYACVLIGSLSGNPAMILWQLGLWTGLTALYRLLYAKQALTSTTKASRSLVGRVVLFSEPRGTWAYDVHTGLAIALLIFAQIPETDLLRRLFAYLSGG
jgi:archaetidylinositol phosphate synthase